MISKYSVIQFAPNAISGERINIGVLAYSEEETQVKFIKDWRRVKVFAGADIDFLRDFAEEMHVLASRQIPLPLTNGGEPLTPSKIQEIALSWANSITITAPRASTNPVEKLLETIEREFLTKPIRQPREYRDRISAASIARESLRVALIEHEGEEAVEKYLHSDRLVDGKYSPHVFDAVIANGKPSIVAQGISFELPRAIRLDQSVDALAWQIIDTKEAIPEITIGILTLAPRARSSTEAKKEYERATRTYSGLDADIVLEVDAEAWAKDQIVNAEL